MSQTKHGAHTALLARLTGILVIAIVVGAAVAGGYGYGMIGPQAAPGPAASKTPLPPAGFAAAAEPTADALWAATKEAVLQIELARPTASLTEQPKVLKPTPTRNAASTPIPARFRPIPGSTAMGDGALVQIAPPFSGSAYQVVNGWYRDAASGTERTVVWAGSATGPGGVPTGRGAVVVVTWHLGAQDGPASAQSTEPAAYLSPVDDGPLRIAGASGDLLILEAGQERRLCFRVSERRYVTCPG